MYNIVGMYQNTDDDVVLSSDMAEAWTGLHGTILTGKSQVIGSMSSKEGAIWHTSDVSSSSVVSVCSSEVER